jgi:glycerol-3-phosphate dehydrogenase
MATRRPLARNNHLEEAMALLIRNQAAFVEQIARNDQERQALREWQHKTQVWQDKTEDRLAKIEVSLAELPQTILRSLLAQLPKAVKKEIGFTPQT